MGFPIPTVIDLGRPVGDVEALFRSDRFGNMEGVRYASRLLPHGDWTEGLREVRVPVRDMAPGRYRLEVRASNQPGEWGPPSAVAFEIASPIWQRGWFLLVSATGLVGGAVAVAGWATRAWMRRKLRRAEQATMLERERMRIARNLHDDLGANVTRMNLLLQRLRGLDAMPAEALGRVADGLRITEETRRSLDAAVWAVKPANDGLPELVAYLGQWVEDLCDEAGIEPVLELPASPPNRSLGAEWRHHVVLIVKEAAHNALRHSGGTEVRLTLGVEQDGLRVELSDNGKGFARPGGSTPGHGLDHFRQRALALQGRVEVMPVPAGGTRVSAFLPWPKTP